MTPAERIERDYERLKPETVRAVGSKLRAIGASYPVQDVEAFYNQAWHGLYERLAAGGEVHNIPGFLVEVAYRRAIDDFRRLRVDERAELDAAALSGADDDVVDRLDDQRRLREFVEGLRDELTDRDRLAATLCYVHGYSRPEAAEAMGLSAGRMKKVMDRVSKAVGTLTQQIDAGTRCEGRASVNRAYALGLLDEDGPRYAAARAHLDECPACRADVLRMRGLASIAPPALLPWAAALAAGGSGGGSSNGDAPKGDGGSRATTAAVAAAVVLAIAAVLAVATLGGADEPAERADAPSSTAAASPPPTKAKAPRERPEREASPRQERTRDAEAKADGAAARPTDTSPPAAATSPAPQAAAPATQPVPVVAPVPAPADEAPTATADRGIDESGVQEFGVEP